MHSVHVFAGYFSHEENNYSFSINLAIRSLFGFQELFA